MCAMAGVAQTYGHNSHSGSLVVGMGLVSVVITSLLDSGCPIIKVFDGAMTMLFEIE